MLYTYFGGRFCVYRKFKQKHREVQYTTPPCCGFPYQQHSALVWCICYSWWANTFANVYDQALLFLYNSRDSDRCIMSCIHHYNIIQNASRPYRSPVFHPSYILSALQQPLIFLFTQKTIIFKRGLVRLENSLGRLEDHAFHIQGNWFKFSEYSWQNQIKVYKTVKQ